MSAINLSGQQKAAVQEVTGRVLQDKDIDLEATLVRLVRGEDASWHRFLTGAYNHPVTWWIGVFQLQMQMGLWGRRYRSSATVRANLLGRVSEPVQREMAGLIEGQSAPILRFLLHFNMKYRKADIFGRLTGGAFTNYASTAGRFGNTRMSGNMKRVRAMTNFGIASYGAAIKAVALGMNSYEAIVQSVLTGRPEQAPVVPESIHLESMSEEEASILVKLNQAFAEIDSMAKLAPGPVALSEFCARPENASLKEVCM